MLEQWKDDEHHVVVLQQPGVFSEDVAKSAVSVTHLNIPKSLRSVPRMIIGLNRVVRALQPDVVHSHLLQSDFVSLICPGRKFRRYTSVHISDIGKYDPSQTRLLSRVVALLSFRFTAAIATSTRSVEFMRRVGYRCNSVVVNNGTPRVEPVNYQQEPLTFLSLARFHEVKGHDVLISAFSEHLKTYPSSRLLCAGHGVDMDNPDFVSFVGANLGDMVNAGSVELVGPTKDTRALFSRSSVLVISSIGTETFPMVGSEACMHGIPVITTDVGDAHKFPGDSRWVVEPRSAMQMADAMNAFASLSSKEREVLSADSRERALAEFDLEKVAATYTLLYRGLNGLPKTPDNPLNK
ncbi:glycosyltransferase [Arthrobacter sp. Sa2CUA1]|uniref:Glycosyltransferase n=1 Tax=Arthrobacter gallicola TaxID=2762225 RepID=A0ABR8UU60_9MICC|nr:glycosyltransferase [Arthrobacter gallicola]